METNVKHFQRRLFEWWTNLSMENYMFGENARNNWCKEKKHPRNDEYNGQRYGDVFMARKRIRKYKI